MLQRFTRLMALLLALLMLTSSVALADGYSALVKPSRATIYRTEDLSKKGGTLKKNTIVTILYAEDGVARIEYKGRKGYAPAEDFVPVADVSKLTSLAQDSRIYASASKSAKSVKAYAGLQVSLLDIKGEWAAIERNGNLGFIKVNRLNGYTDYKPETSEPDDKPNGAVTCNFKAAVSAKKLTVYASASTNARKLGTMKRGTVVTVLAYNKTWAYIDLDGHRGHVKHSGLTKNLPEATSAPVEQPAATPVPTAKPTPAPTPTPKPTPDYSGSSLSNEQTIYAFLINECGFNTAAAAGVLANIKAESGFRPTALNSIGCYGICQWYQGRRTRLNNFCEDNGFDSASLEGQLWYLKYELQNHYKGTWNYLRGVDNTAQGAYDAAYYWCYYFEVPGNRTANSIKRGNSAKDTYFPKYAK